MQVYKLIFEFFIYLDVWLLDDEIKKSCVTETWQLTDKNVSATSNWPVLRKCNTIVRSSAAIDDADEKRSGYEGREVGNFYEDESGPRRIDIRPSCKYLVQGFPQSRQNVVDFFLSFIDFFLLRLHCESQLLQEILAAASRQKWGLGIIKCLQQRIKGLVYGGTFAVCISSLLKFCQFLQSRVHVVEESCWEICIPARLHNISLGFHFNNELCRWGRTGEHKTA